MRQSLSLRTSKAAATESILPIIHTVHSEFFLPLKLMPFFGKMDSLLVFDLSTRGSEK